MNRDGVEAICRSFPGVTEDIKWGAALCFSVCGKLFAVLPENPNENETISFQVTEDQFLTLPDSPEIIAAPYFARMKWVQVQKWSRFSDDEWQTNLRQAYELVKLKLSKKRQRELDGLG